MPHKRYLLALRKMYSWTLSVTRKRSGYHIRIKLRYLAAAAYKFAPDDISDRRYETQLEFFKSAKTQ